MLIVKPASKMQLWASVGHPCGTDFKLEPFRVEAADLEQLAHLIDQIAIDLDRRDVHRDAHVVRPAFRSFDRLAHGTVGFGHDIFGFRQTVRSGGTLFF